MKKMICFILSFVFLCSGIFATATLTSAATPSVQLGFQSVTPALTAEQIAKATYDLGQIEYGTPTMFGFEPIPLTDEAVAAGYHLKEIVLITDSKQTAIATLTDGALFDVMSYLTQLGKYRVWFMLTLYRGEDFVTSTMLEYTFEAVISVVDTLSVRVDPPVIGGAPHQNVREAGTGYTVDRAEWFYFDEDTYGYYAMGDGMVFEEGKTYQVVIRLTPDTGFIFPENKNNLSVLVNGNQGSLVYEYSEDLAQVCYEFTAVPAGRFGDVDENGQVSAADALQILKAVVGKIQLNAQQVTAADVDGNGQVTAADALLVLKKVVGKIDRFPVEE